jgi:hypothetical protein
MYEASKTLASSGGFLNLQPRPLLLPEHFSSRGNTGCTCRWQCPRGSYWGAYTRYLDPDEHQPGKRHTQQIERTHLTLRTRIKRLTRQTICFSRSTWRHDIVIGLFVNRYEFGLAV